MPDQSSNQTALRASGHKRHVYLSDLSGDVVATYAVAATPASVSAFNVTTTLSSGASADVQHGMRVVVETAGGLPKGVLNVASNRTISDITLPLREVSKGQVALAVGDVLKVYDDFPLVDKLTDATANFAPDAETYVDQYGDPKPLVGSGGHYAGWLADASAVPTDGSTSLNLDPDTAATLTDLWAATGGTLSSTSAQSPTVDFSSAGAGKYRLKHTVTAANGKARVQNTRYRIHDADDPPFTGTEESPLVADPVNGWSYSIRVYDPAAFSLSPLAPVVVWVDETIAGVNQSFGAKALGRSRIKCVGYLRRARSGWDESEGRYYVIYDIVSALEMLRELPGFSKVFQNDATPANWSEQKTLTHKRAWLYLALYYTNANEAGHDLALDDGGMMDKLYAAFFIQKTDPLSQWLELARGVDCRVTCDRTGRIEAQQRLELIPLASRGAVATTLSLTKADIIAYEMEHDFKEPVETFRARGFTAGSTGNDPLFARWPASPAYGNQSQTDEKLVCDDTDDHYERTAMRGAYANKTFTDANRVKYHAPKMTVRLPGSYDVFDLYKEWVGVTITDEPRITTTATFRWLVEQISTNWEAGTGDVELTLQAETNGYDAVDDTPLTGEDNGLEPWTPGDFYNPPFPTTPLILNPHLLGPLGTQTIATFWTDNYLRICGPNYAGSGRGFDVSSAQGGPLHVEINMAALSGWPGGTTLDFVVEPDSPAIIGTGTQVHGWIITTTSRVRIADIFGTSTLSHGAALTGTTSLRRMDMTRAAPNFVGVVSYLQNVGGVVFDYTATGDGSWAAKTITSHYDTLLIDTWIPAIYLDQRVGGRIIVPAFVNTADFRAGTLVADGYLSTDAGANFARISNPDINPGAMLANSIFKSYTGSAYYHGYSVWNGSTSPARLKRVVGATIADISPDVGGTLYGPRFGIQRSLSVPDDNPNFLFFIGSENYDIAGTEIMGYITDPEGAAAFTLLAGPVAYGGIPWQGSYAISPQAVYLLGNGDVGFFNGSVIDSRKGNIVTAARCVGLCGGG